MERQDVQETDQPERDDTPIPPITLPTFSELGDEPPVFRHAESISTVESETDPFVPVQTINSPSLPVPAIYNSIVNDLCRMCRQTGCYGLQLLHQKREYIAMLHDSIDELQELLEDRQETIRQLIMRLEQATNENDRTIYEARISLYRSQCVVARHELNRLVSIHAFTIEVCKYMNDILTTTRDKATKGKRRCKVYGENSKRAIISWSGTPSQCWVMKVLTHLGFHPVYMPTTGDVYDVYISW